MMIGLRPTRSDSEPKQEEAGVPISKRRAIIRMLAVVGVDLQRLRQEEQRVELTRVPDHGLAGGQAEQREDHDLQILPSGQMLRSSGAFEVLPSALMRGNTGDSFSCRRIHTEIASRTIDSEERNAPAPGGEASSPIRWRSRESPAATGTGRAWRWSGSKRCRTRACRRRMLGDVGCGAAVFAAECKTLQQAHQRSGSPATPMPIVA